MNIPYTLSVQDLNWEETWLKKAEILGGTWILEVGWCVKLSPLETHQKQPLLGEKFEVIQVVTLSVPEDLE